MSLLTQDLRYGLRHLGRQPAFTAAAVLTLAIGVGSNTALFSLANSVLWKPLPYHDPQRLVEVSSLVEGMGSGRSNLSYPNFLDLERQTETLEVAVYDWEPFSLAGGERPSRVGAAQVSHGFFGVLGVEPLLGRGFHPEEDRPGGAEVVILGERLWRSYFGGDPSIVGQDVILNGATRTVVGVTPAAAEFPDDVALYVPLGLDPESGRSVNWLKALGRLRPGVELEAARAEVETVGRRLAEQYPQMFGQRTFTLRPLQEALTGPMRLVSMGLLGAVAFVMLIVCANVANLVLGRALGRGQEVAVRAALGAGRLRLVRQLLTESLLLGLAGGGIGFLLGWMAINRLVRLIPVEIPPWIRQELDARVVLYTVGVSLVAVLLFGLAPALRASRIDLSDSLRGSSPRGERRTHRLRSVLVAAEVGLSLVLLAGSGLMIRSVLVLGAVDPGFRPPGVLSVGLDLLAHGQKSAEERRVLFERFYDRLQAIPGVEAVGAIDGLPLSGRSNQMSITLEGQSDEAQQANPAVLVSQVSAGYLEAVGIPLLAGRPFSRLSSAGDPGVIVSRLMAELLWPDQDPLGRRFKFGPVDSSDGWRVVQGVVGDVRHFGLEEAPVPALYVSQDRAPLTRNTWVLRSSADLRALAEAVPGAVEEVDPLQPLYQIRPLTEVVEESIWIRRFFGQVLWIFAAVAVVLAAVGIYAVVAYNVSQRSFEVGVRLALGARAGEVVALMLRQGFTTVLVGVVVALPVTYGVGKLLESLLFGVGVVDPISLAAVTLLLLAVAALAIWIPARRAALVDPVRSLRHE